jgi:hypothetical protein
MRATRHWIGALVLFSIAGSLHPSCGVAQVSTQYPFCLQGEDYPGWSNCTFTGFQECQASASGTLNECMSNPWYQAGADAAQPSSQGPSVNDGPIPIGPPPR